MPAHVGIVGRTVRTGKRKVKRDKRTLKLSRYVLDPKTGKRMKAGELPKSPPQIVRSHLIPEDAWGMMVNDERGDCTIAAGGHAAQITSAVQSNGTNIHTPSDEEILAAYWATGNPPTPGADDNGRYELDVLNYWRNVGIGGSKIYAYAALDLKHLHGQVRYCIDLFGFCYIGVGLPISAQSQMVWRDVGRGPNSKPWSWGGHAVVLVDYDKRGPTCVTWGALVRMTWSFFKRYCDEAYAVITPEWMDTGGPLDPQSGLSPAGFNLDQLQEDLAAVAS